MSIAFLQPPIVPRNGQRLQVVMVCRVSDPTKQDERSPDEQGQSLDEWLRRHADYEFEVTYLYGSGSGERLGRREYTQLLDLIATRKIDVVLTEDLGRIVRRIHAHLICERCVDFDTRLISPFVDQIDTAISGWQDRSIFAAWHHERSNRDTSQRIRRAKRARFQQGGSLTLLIYGYCFSPGLAPTKERTEKDVEKVPEAEPIYKTWFQMLDDGAGYCEVADWLNSQNVPLGPYVRSKTRWDGALVSDCTHNKVLKGLRVHNELCSRRINSSGAYRSTKAAPEDRLERVVPHWAFFDPAYYDRVVDKVDARYKKHGRAPNGQADPRKDVPRKRTRFPGQTIDCGICGRPYVFGAHGQKHYLMCFGARDYVCWNGLSLDGRLAAERISSAILSAIESLAGFDARLVAEVQHESSQFDLTSRSVIDGLTKDLATTDNEIANLVKAIKGGLASQSVSAELTALEAKRPQIQFELAEARRQSQDKIVIPTIDELKQIARESFRQLALDGFEFARALRRITGRIVVYPFSLFNEAPFVLRAKLRFSLVHLVCDKRLVDALAPSIERTLVVDLFKQPKYLAYREQVVPFERDLTHVPQ